MFKKTNYSGKDSDYNRESHRYYREDNEKSNSHEEELDDNDPDDNDVKNPNGEDTFQLMTDNT